MKKLELYIICVLIAFIAILSFSYNRMLSDYEKAVNNNKAYERLLDSTKNNNAQFQLTIKELKSSKDSVIQKMNDVVKELEIKNKNVKQIQYVRTTTYVMDSIHITDTIFKQDFSLDTIIQDDWHKLRLKLEYPAAIDVESSFKNETYIVAHAKKETIKPASKIFFVRWFQRKQQIIEVNVVQKNPYTENTEQRFIEVIK